MKNYRVIGLVICIMLMHLLKVNAQVGYYDAPYTRYEADLGTLTNAASTTRSYAQGLLQSEASGQVCVNLSNAGAAVSWNVTADGDGLVVRYCVPDGQTSYLDVYANGTFVGTMTLSTYYSWEYLSSNGNPNNVGVSNTNPKMRFDEVRMKLPTKILVGQTLRLVRNSGTIYLDFAELEPVPAAVTASGGNVVYGGNGSDLQAFINANGGATIYLPAGVYNVNNELYFGVDNTVLKGAGMWYTQVNFTNGTANNGGLRANANNISYSGLFLTTNRNSRSNSYKAINGVYTAGSLISNVWAEHFECGAWIGQYNVGAIAAANGFTVINCRFRNNYADGINLCKGTSNTIVEHCSFRNNGDDDMAIWCANGQECQNNTFRYNTSENCWRASGCAIYGGLNNNAHHLLIRDNLEVGLRVGNNFPGVGFNAGGMHTFSNIMIIRCGTYNDLYNTPVGAIDIHVSNVAGTRINNVKFSCIDIIDSKNDAIYIEKNTGGDGFYNLVFENIDIDGTGREFPNNDATGVNGARGFMVLFKGSPAGNGSYCNMNYTNRGGNATVDVNTSQIGSFSWPLAGTCPGGCVLGSATTITSPTGGTTFTGCPVGPITISANTTAPSGNTVNYVEFFVDGVSIGTDNTSAYSIVWNAPTDGTHALTAVAYYTPSNITSASTAVNIVVGGEVNYASSAPVINGTIDPLWSTFGSFALTQGSTTAPDLAASYKITYDATNLYILVDVTDDDLRNDGGNNWDNDGIEIYIDMGNNKPATYGANDYQYSFVYNDATVYETKHNATAGVTFAQGAKAGGYVMELKFPWSTLGSTPTAGTQMGFDIKINDDDGGGTRDHELAWKDGTYTAWNNPSLFGTVQFSSCSPLPVELVEFTGVRVNNSVVLTWSTSSEQSNHKFIVERSSNLMDWEILGEVKGSGNAHTLSSYSFVDHTAGSGPLYYRLLQLDADLSTSYSTVVFVSSTTSSVCFAPNPFEEEITLIGSVNQEITITIFDVVGRIVFQTKCNGTTESTTIHPSIPSGVYWMTLQSSNFMEQKQIIRK